MYQVIDMSSYSPRKGGRNITRNFEKEHFKAEGQGDFNRRIAAWRIKQKVGFLQLLFLFHQFNPIYMNYLVQLCHQLYLLVIIYSLETPAFVTAVYLWEIICNQRLNPLKSQCACVCLCTCSAVTRAPDYSARRRAKYGGALFMAGLERGGAAAHERAVVVRAGVQQGKTHTHARTPPSLSHTHVGQKQNWR